MQQSILDVNPCNDHMMGTNGKDLQQVPLQMLELCCLVIGHRLGPNSAHINPETGGNLHHVLRDTAIRLDPTIVKRRRSFCTRIVENFH